MLGKLLAKGCAPVAALAQGAGEHEEHGEHETTHAARLLERVNTFGSCILLFACGVALVNTALLLLGHALDKPQKMWLALTQPSATVTLDRIKLELGRGIAFALEVLVAADVIETLCKPMHQLGIEEIYKMLLVGAIRTGLAFFLAKELNLVANEVAHQAQCEVQETPSAIEALESKKED